MKRLQTDYIDLYQAHLDDLLTPLEETLGAFAELMKAGKIRAIGASNYHAGRLAQALQSSRQRQYPQYESLQPLYNLYDRAEFETELQPVCLENNLGVICYFSLASGFLTGKYRSARDLTGRARADMVRKYMNHRGYRILEALDRVAREHHANPAQVSLAWLLTRPAVTAPIASATNLEQMKDLMAAAELRLGTGELQLLDEASR